MKLVKINLFITLFIIIFANVVWKQPSKKLLKNLFSASLPPQSLGVFALINIMTDLFKTRIESFYSNMEKIDIEIEKLQKSKTKLYWDKSVLKTELELYYNYMIGKKAVCLTENGTHIYKCTKVLISDDFKPLPKFSSDNGKKVSVLDFDWI